MSTIDSKETKYEKKTKKKQNNKNKEISYEKIKKKENMERKKEFLSLE